MTKKENIAVGFVLLLFLIIGTFADLSISKLIYSPESWFPKLFELIGETPGMLIGLFCCSLLIITRDSSSKVLSIIQLIGFSILMILFSLMTSFMLFHYLGIKSGFGLIALSSIFIIVAFFAASKLDTTQKAAIRRAAFIGIFLILFAIISVNIIKVLWGRQRFRSMQDDMTVFTHWYNRQTFASGEEFKSFPSGHSANSAVIMWITLLPTFIKSLKGKETILKTIAFGWILCVMASRIMAGAHFLSDVTVGTFCTFAGFLILCKLIKEKQINVGNKIEKSYKKAM